MKSVSPAYEKLQYTEENIDVRDGIGQQHHCMEGEIHNLGIWEFENLKIWEFGNLGIKTLQRQIKQ
jgi:hypothetical protein